MRIAIRQKTFARAVGNANFFTEKKAGSDSNNQSCVLIQADREMGTLTFTANSEHNAIEFVLDRDLDVLESGRVLVPSIHLNTALSTIRNPETMVTCELTESGRNLHLTGDTTDIQLSTKEISSDQNALIPRIHDAGEPALIVKPDEFVNAYHTGSVACNPGDKHLVMRGVHVEVAEEKLRFISVSGSSMTYSFSPVVKRPQESFACILDSAITREILSYLTQGDLVSISLDDKENIHYLIHSGDDLIYHISTSTFDCDPDKFPAKRVCDKIASFLGSSEYSIAVDKAELLQMMNSADRMMALYPADNQGQSKTVKISVIGDELSTEIFGGAEYSDRTKVEWNGGDFRCIFKWGLFGSLLSSYPESIIQIQIYENEGKPNLLILHTAEWNELKVQENAPSLPDDYICIIPITDGEHDNLN